MGEATVLEILIRIRVGSGSVAFSDAKSFWNDRDDEDQ